MKIMIDPAHREFFNDNGYIQFDDLLSNEQIEKIQHEINLTLSKRDNDLLHAGHDIWRSSKSFNKILKQRELGAIASELLLRKPIRLGYDQYLSPPLTYPFEYSLNHISSIQGILCGLLICLVDSEMEITSSCLPSKAGDGTFFQPDFEFPWDQLSQSTDQTFLLIVYTHERALYIYKKGDPHHQSLKDFGYAYGDRLTDEWHPIVYQ